MTTDACPKCGAECGEYHVFLCGTADCVDDAGARVLLESELCITRQQLAEREREIERLAALARSHEPNHGWGTRTLINDAWADGFRTACVEISDKLATLADPASKEESGA